jgi:hypothetical protein
MRSYLLRSLLERAWLMRLLLFSTHCGIPLEESEFAVLAGQHFSCLLRIFSYVPIVLGCPCYAERLLSWSQLMLELDCHSN